MDGLLHGDNAVEYMRPSCHQFKDSAVELALFVLAYSLRNFLRRLVLQVAEVATTRDLSAQVLSRIRRLSPAPT